VHEVAHRPHDAKGEKGAEEGGRPVSALNSGTESSATMPSANITPRSNAVVSSGPSSAGAPGAKTGLPRMRQATIASGTSALASEGTSSRLTIAEVVTWPPIHSIVVVTSPIGDHAPPAFEAMTIMPASISRSRCSPTRRRTRDTMTMATVMLASTADSAKVTAVMSTVSVASDRVFRREVITANPSCASTTSTTVITPIRKKAIWAVSTSE